MAVAKRAENPCDRSSTAAAVLPTGRISAPLPDRGLVSRRPCEPGQLCVPPGSYVVAGGAAAAAAAAARRTDGHTGPNGDDDNDDDERSGYTAAVATVVARDVRRSRRRVDRRPMAVAVVRPPT